MVIEVDGVEVLEENTSTEDTPGVMVVTVELIWVMESIEDFDGDLMPSQGGRLRERSRAGELTAIVSDTCFTGVKILVGRGSTGTVGLVLEACSAGSSD